MKKIFAIALVIFISGCSNFSVYEPQPVSDKHSYAFNIANQTPLTKRFPVTVPSPLRDFTNQEVAESETALNKSAGGLSIGLGALNMLTGDLTGIIDVAGGSAAKLASSGHMAAEPRWIVLLNRDDYASKAEAQDEMIERITKAQIKALSQYGEVGEGKHDLSSAVYSYLTLDGSPVFGGSMEFGAKKFNDALMELDNFQFDGGKYYAYGFDVTANKVGVAMPMVYNVENKDKPEISISELMIAITKELPENYFIYMPSFPRQLTGLNKDNKFRTYVNYTEVVPTIYTQGKAHKFIKPDANKS